MSRWTNFVGEVRSLSSQRLGAPNFQVAPTPAPSHYAVASEAGIAAKIVVNALEKTGDVLAAHGVRPTYADRSTGIHIVSSLFPDTIVQRSLQDGKTRIIGEFKTPWTTLLDAIDFDQLGRVLGQVVKYMDAYTCRYGFLCTYEQAVFVRRISQYRIEVSPVIYGDNVSDAGVLSMRECSYFLARLASTAGWEYHGSKGGPDLVNGTYRADLGTRSQTSHTR